MKKHDESKDVRLLSRKMRIDTHNKTISAPKGCIIGNTSWGRIDYLTHYCGYHFIWTTNIKPINPIYIDRDGNEINKRKAKKEAKAPQLKNKKK